MKPFDPLHVRWTGDSFVPVNGFWQKKSDAALVVGQDYFLEERQERSSASHRAYFAAVHDAWVNLPDALAVEYPNAEKLRKHALIKAGYADSQTFVCGSRAEAIRFQAFLKPIDEFSIVLTESATVTRYTAKSQSMRAMGKETFQKSKDAVLEVLAGMIGTTPAELSRNAEAA